MKNDGPSKRKTRLPRSKKTISFWLLLLLCVWLQFVCVYFAVNHVINDQFFHCSAIKYESAFEGNRCSYRRLKDCTNVNSSGMDMWRWASLPPNPHTQANVQIHSWGKSWAEAHQRKVYGTKPNNNNTKFVYIQVDSYWLFFFFSLFHLLFLSQQYYICCILMASFDTKPMIFGWRCRFGNDHLRYCWTPKPMHSVRTYKQTNK